MLGGRPFVLSFFKPEFKGPDPKSILQVTVEAVLNPIQYHMGLSRQWAKASHCVQPSIPRVSDQSMASPSPLLRTLSTPCLFKAPVSARASAILEGQTESGVGAGEDTLGAETRWYVSLVSRELWEPLQS